MSISKTIRATRSAATSEIAAICNFVKDLEDSGEYINATLALGEWWQGVGVRPKIDQFPVIKKAEILNRVGVLSGWLGSMQQVPGSQEKAKDLISESATLFESIGEQQN